MPTLYWKSTCTTARNVRAALRAVHPALPDRNYGKEPLTPDEVRAIVTAAGGVGEVLNTRHEIAKERGWKQQLPEVETFVQAAVAECNLLRRPILLVGGRAIVGDQREAMLSALGA
jgi:arsenate reductase-like glutaredoxin family protein